MMTAWPAQSSRGPTQLPELTARLIAKSTNARAADAPHEGDTSLRGRPARSCTPADVTAPCRFRAWPAVGPGRAGPGQVDVHVHQAGHQPAPAQVEGADARRRSRSSGSRASRRSTARMRVALDQDARPAGWRARPSHGMTVAVGERRGVIPCHLGVAEADVQPSEVGLNPLTRCRRRRCPAGGTGRSTGNRPRPASHLLVDAWRCAAAHPWSWRPCRSARRPSDSRSPARRCP